MSVCSIWTRKYAAVQASIVHNPHTDNPPTHKRPTHPQPPHPQSSRTGRYLSPSPPDTTTTTNDAGGLSEVGVVLSGWPQEHYKGERVTALHSSPSSFFLILLPPPLKLLLPPHSQIATVVPKNIIFFCSYQVTRIYQ